MCLRQRSRPQSLGLEDKFARGGTEEFTTRRHPRHSKAVVHASLSVIRHLKTGPKAKDDRIKNGLKTGD